MSKIGDLFVRLGLKKDGFDKGIKDASTKAKGFGSTFGKIKGAATAAFAAIGATALAAANSFAHTSQRFGDMWDSTVAQMRSAWDVFTNSLTNWNWEGFADRIRNAMKGARDAFNAEDMAFEVQNSIDLRKAANMEQLSSLRIAMQDQTKSYEERNAAAQDYLDTVEKYYNEENKLRESIARDQTKKFLGQAGLANTAANADALYTFLTQVANNPDLLNALDQYSRRNRGAKKYKFTNQDKALVDDFIGRYGNVGAYTTLAEFYQGTSDKNISAVVNAMKAALYSRGAFQEENRRIFSMLNSTRSQMSGDSMSADQLQAQQLKQAASEVREAWTQLESLGNPLEGIAPAVRESSADIADSLRNMVQETMQADILQRNHWRGSFEEWENYLYDMADVMQQASQQIKQAIVAGFADSIGTLTDALTGVEKIDAGKAFANLLKPMAEAVTSIGEMIMMTGLAEVAFKKSLTNPYAAIAAGAALVAIGKLASSGIQRALNGSSSASTSTGSDSTTRNVDYSGELTVYVEGRIKGDDIVISGQRSLNAWNR